MSKVPNILSTEIQTQQKKNTDGYQNKVKADFFISSEKSDDLNLKKT